jgi:hypothetical protein
MRNLDAMRKTTKLTTGGGVPEALTGLRKAAVPGYPKAPRPPLPPEVASLPHFLIAGSRGGGAGGVRSASGGGAVTSELQFAILALLLAQRMGLRVTLLEPSAGQAATGGAGGYVLEVEVAPEVDDEGEDWGEEGEEDWEEAKEEEGEEVELLGSAGADLFFLGGVKTALGAGPATGASRLAAGPAEWPRLDGSFGDRSSFVGDSAWDFAAAHLAATRQAAGASVPEGDDEGLLYLRLCAGSGCCRLLTGEELSRAVSPASVLAYDQEPPPLDALLVQLGPLHIFEALAEAWAGWMQRKGDLAGAGFWRLQLLLIEKLLIDEQEGAGKAGGALGGAAFAGGRLAQRGQLPGVSGRIGFIESVQEEEEEEEEGEGFEEDEEEDEEGEEEDEEEEDDDDDDEPYGGLSRREFQP